MVRNTTSFEERIMAANPEAAAPVELPHPLNCNLATLVDGSSTQQRWRDTPRSSIVYVAYKDKALVKHCSSRLL